MFSLVCRQLPTSSHHIHLPPHLSTAEVALDLPSLTANMSSSNRGAAATPAAATPAPGAGADAPESIGFFNQLVRDQKVAYGPLPPASPADAANGAAPRKETNSQRMAREEMAKARPHRCASRIDDMMMSIYQFSFKDVPSRFSLFRQCMNQPLSDTHCSSTA